MSITPYTVTLNTPKGEAKLDLSATSTARAANRARVAAFQLGWGDLFDIEVTDVTPTAELEDV